MPYMFQPYRAIIRGTPIEARISIKLCSPSESILKQELSTFSNTKVLNININAKNYYILSNLIFNR
jgi:hypothetical protein